MYNCAFLKIYSNNNVIKDSKTNSNKIIINTDEKKPLKQISSNITKKEVINI